MGSPKPLTRDQQSRVLDNQDLPGIVARKVFGRRAPDDAVSVGALTLVCVAGNPVADFRGYAYASIRYAMARWVRGEIRSTMSPLCDLDLARDPEPDDCYDFPPEDLDRAMAALGERERFVIGHRYGIGHTPKSPSSVAWLLGATKDRVMFVESEALRKMRSMLEPGTTRKEFAT